MKGYIYRNSGTDSRMTCVATYSTRNGGKVVRGVGDTDSKVHVWYSMLDGSYLTTSYSAGSTGHGWRRP